MLNLRVRVATGGFENNVKARFQLRDEYILVHVSGNIGYVLDDENRLHGLRLSAMTILSLEPTKKLVTLQEVMAEKSKEEDKKKAKAKKDKKSEPKKEEENVE